MTALLERETAQATEQSPVERMIEVFTEASHLMQPGKWDNATIDSWINPLAQIDKAALQDDYMIDKAIKESVNHCRENDIMITSPKSILSNALRLIGKWQGSRARREPTQQEYIRYREHLIEMGYNVRY